MLHQAGVGRTTGFGDRLERPGGRGRLGDPVGEQPAQRLLSGDQELTLVGEVSEKVLLVTSARSAIGAAVVSSYPCSSNRSTAAVPRENFGPFGPIFAMDQPTSSGHTREALGWLPTHPGLLKDLENIQP